MASNATSPDAGENVGKIELRILRALWEDQDHGHSLEWADLLKECGVPNGTLGNSLRSLTRKGYLFSGRSPYTLTDKGLEYVILKSRKEPGIIPRPRSLKDLRALTEKVEALPDHDQHKEILLGLFKVLKEMAADEAYRQERELR